MIMIIYLFNIYLCIKLLVCSFIYLIYIYLMLNYGYNQFQEKLVNLNGGIGGVLLTVQRGLLYIEITVHLYQSIPKKIDTFRIVIVKPAEH